MSQQEKQQSCTATAEVLTEECTVISADGKAQSLQQSKKDAKKTMYLSRI
jgi:hypothetical protein